MKDTIKMLEASPGLRIVQMGEARYLDLIRKERTLTDLMGDEVMITINPDRYVELIEAENKLKKLLDKT